MTYTESLSVQCEQDRIITAKKCPVPMLIREIAVSKRELKNCERPLSGIQDSHSKGADGKPERDLMN